MTRMICVLSFMLSALALRAASGADQTTSAPVSDSVLDPAGVEFFDKNIGPMLSKHCYACHSAGAAKIKGQLLLDSREGLAKGGEGGAVIIAGQPEKSRLIEAIRWMNPDFQMPPSKKLSPGE